MPHDPVVKAGDPGGIVVHPGFGPFPEQLIARRLPAGAVQGIGRSAGPRAAAPAEFAVIQHLGLVEDHGGIEAVVGHAGVVPVVGRTEASGSIKGIPVIRGNNVPLDQGARQHGRHGIRHDPHSRAAGALPGALVFLTIGSCGLDVELGDRGVGPGRHRGRPDPVAGPDVTIRPAIVHGQGGPSRIDVR